MGSGNCKAGCMQRRHPERQRVVTTNSSPLGSSFASSEECPDPASLLGQLGDSAKVKQFGEVRGKVLRRAFVGFSKTQRRCFCSKTLRT